VLSSLFFGLIGLSIPLLTSPIQTYFLTITPKEILGRTSSVLGMICTCITPLGCAASGVISEYVSISALFCTMGIVICLISVLLIFNKNFR